MEHAILTYLCLALAVCLLVMAIYYRHRIKKLIKRHEQLNTMRLIQLKQLFIATDNKQEDNTL